VRSIYFGLEVVTSEPLELDIRKLVRVETELGHNIGKREKNSIGNLRKNSPVVLQNVSRSLRNALVLTTPPPPPDHRHVYHYL
jgi:hypothetical protein